MLAEIFGWEFFAVLAVLVLLFGGSRIPKMARSIGAAKSEFEKGIKEGHTNAERADADRPNADRPNPGATGTGTSEGTTPTS